MCLQRRERLHWGALRTTTGLWGAAGDPDIPDSPLWRVQTRLVKEPPCTAAPYPCHPLLPGSSQQCAQLASPPVGAETPQIGPSNHPESRRAGCLQEESSLPTEALCVSPHGHCQPWFAGKHLLGNGVGFVHKAKQGAGGGGEYREGLKNMSTRKASKPGSRAEDRAARGRTAHPVLRSLVPRSAAPGRGRQCPHTLLLPRAGTNPVPKHHKPQHPANAARARPSCATSSHPFTFPGSSPVSPCSRLLSHHLHMQKPHSPPHPGSWLPPIPAHHPTTAPSFPQQRLPPVSPLPLQFHHFHHLPTWHRRHGLTPAVWGCCVPRGSGSDASSTTGPCGAAIVLGALCFPSS